MTRVIPPEWVSWHFIAGPDILAAVTPALIAVGLFKLAISEAGREAQSLALVQTGLFVVSALCLLTGLLKRVAVGRQLLAMTAVVAITSVGSVRPDSSVREFMLWITYSCFFVLVASTIRTKEGARRFLDALVLTAGWIALIGLYLFWGSNDPGMRWYSTFYWPNPFAAFLLLVIPLELSRLAHARGWRETFVHGAVTVLLSVPFILTYSRGAWLIFAAVLVPALLLFRPPSRLALLGRLAATSAVVFVAVILLTRGAAPSPSPQKVLGRAVSVANASDNSIQGRLNFWTSGLEMFRDRPVLGVGPGAFAYVHPAYQHDVKHYARDAHSLYIQTAAEQGLIGLIALGGILFSLAWLCVRLLRRSRGREEYPFIAGVGVGLAAFLLHSALDMNWQFPINPAMAMSLAGVLAAYDQLLADNHAGTAGIRIRPWWRWPAVAVLVAAVVVVQFLQLEQRYVRAAVSDLRARRWADSAANLQIASRLNPLDPKVPSGLAVARERLGAGRDEITGLIERSRMLDAMNAYYVVQLAEFVDRSSAPHAPAARRQVRELLSHAVVLDPYHYPNAYGLLARTYADAGEMKQAEGVYHEARTHYGRAVVEDGVLRMMLWPGVARLYTDWAQFLTSQERWAEAEGVYREILDLDARYLPAYLQSVDLLLRQRRPKEALSLLERGLAHVPESELLWKRWRTLSTARGAIWEQ